MHRVPSLILCLSVVPLPLSLSVRVCVCAYVCVCVCMCVCVCVCASVCGKGGATYTKRVERKWGSGHLVREGEREREGGREGEREGERERERERLHDHQPNPLSSVSSVSLSHTHTGLINTVSVPLSH